MTRKPLSLVLALALLLMPFLALAESYQSYTAEDGSLSFFYPEGWLLLSRETSTAFWITPPPSKA